MPRRNSIAFGATDRGGVIRSFPSGTNFGRVVFPDVCAGESAHGKSCRSSEKNLTAANDWRPRPPPQGHALLVRPGHQRKRCARSPRRRFQADGSQTHRRVTEALGGAKPSPQGRTVSIGAVDAGVLYQPRRQKFAGQPPAHLGKSQGRAAPTIRTRIAAAGGVGGADTSGARHAASVSAASSILIS
jgi:hypothetical protein